jgi:hypothetical protein
MRAFIASLVMLMTISAAHADEDQQVEVDLRNGDVLVPASLVRQVLDPRYLDGLRSTLVVEEVRGKQLRNAGIATTVVGSLMTFVGVGLFMHGFCFDSCHDGDGGTFIAGATLIGLGQGGVLAGIPIWAAGQAKASRAEERRLSLNATGATLQF